MGDKGEPQVCVQTLPLPAKRGGDSREISEQTQQWGTLLLLRRYPSGDIIRSQREHRKLIEITPRRTFAASFHDTRGRRACEGEAPAG